MADRAAAPEVRLKLANVVLLVVLACDSKPQADGKSTPTPEEPVLCGLHQAQANEAMLALSKCTAKATALAAEAKTEPATCDDERTHLAAANETYLECIDKQSGGADGLGAAVQKMKGFADAMCECKDKACADKVTAEMVKYGEAMSKKFEGKGEPKIGEEHQKQIEEAMKRLTDCMVKTME
jgi:hypothetical protein